MISNPYHGGNDFVQYTVDAFRSRLPSLESHVFLRVAAININVVVRVYDENSLLIDSYTGVIDNTTKNFVALIGETALPTGAQYAEIDHLSDGAATYFYLETGVPDANSKQVATNISSGAKQTIVIGNYPQE